jgi:hypothetical protein
MARKIINLTKHRQQILDDVILDAGASVVLTDKQEHTLASDDYYASLVVNNMIREEDSPTKSKRQESPLKE